MTARRKISRLLDDIGDSVKDFGEHTSAHGIPRAFSSRTTLKQYLWLLLFFVCLSAFVFEAFHIIQRFLRNDIIVGVELKFENIPFPSVTVCNNNPYKNSLARQLGPIQDTLEAYDTAIEQMARSGRRSKSIENDDVSNIQNPKRIRRQIVHKLYEKIYSEYEGLLAVYSVCECVDKGKFTDCRAMKKNTNGTMCLCFYNRKNEQIWPCYRPEQWLEKKCHKCTPLGDCAYSENEGHLSCVCAPIIRMCVRIEADFTIDFNKNISFNLNNASYTSNKNTSLAQRIPKIWEIEAAKSTNFDAVLDEQKIIEKEVAYGLKGVSDPIAMRSKTTENLVFAMSSLDEIEKSRLSYTKEEFITKCSFNGRQCVVDKDFSLHVDPSYGNCYTFNYNASDHVRVERAGPTYGLRFQVFVNISDYLPTTEAAGVRITVHSPEELPFPEFGYNAPTGFISSFGIRLKRMNRLPSPYGDCEKEGRNEEYIYQGKEYSTEGCIRSCMQRYLVEKCGCGDPRFPRYRNIPNCPATDPKLRECLRREVKMASRAKNCICRQPCKQQVYSVSYSCARWPATIASLSSGECDSSLSAGQCLHFYREQGAMIEVYFEQLNYESLMESEAYGISNLLSDFGGQLGLWMGVSVITIMEVGILIFEVALRLVGCVCRVFKRPNSKIEHKGLREFYNTASDEGESIGYRRTHPEKHHKRRLITRIRHVKDPILADRNLLKYRYNNGNYKCHKQISLEPSLTALLTRPRVSSAFSRRSFASPAIFFRGISSRDTSLSIEYIDFQSEKDDSLYYIKS